MNRVRIFGLILAITVSTTAPVFAQDATEDWDLGRDPERKLAIAAVTYDNFGVAVRCMDDVMSVIVSGLPTRRGIQTVRHRIGDQPEMSGRWVTSEEGGPAFSVWPAATAAYLARGGRWVIEIPNPDRVQRLSVDIPASSSAIGEVFSACGRTLSPTSLDDEPRQDSFGGLQWVRIPTPNFPTRTDAGGGLAAVTCTVTAIGHLRACRVESEFPEGAGFGRATTFAAHRDGRVGPVAPGEMQALEGRTISYMTRFNLSDEVPLPAIATRLPDRTVP